ncbi:MAG TPA: CBS domain-containing protein, partial [Candidatus Binataceae bacterium]|nr:CBS domain-containing protein [Candidatus Binataceae bacterium]
ADGAAVETLLADSVGEETFVPAETQMVQGVLGLADRNIGSIMTPRREIEWINLDESTEATLTRIRNAHHGQLLVSQGTIERVLGLMRKQDLLDLYIEGKAADVRAVIQTPVAIPWTRSILDTIELFKRTPIHAAIVVDERGGLQGLVTQTDLLQAIAGDLAEPYRGDESRSGRREDSSR